MRAFSAAVAVVVLAAVALWATGAWVQRRVDTNVVREQLAARLEQALALPVELGAADLALLPRPALHVRDVRIGAPGGPQLEANELRIEVEKLALLDCRFEPSAFELRGATFDAAGVRLEQLAGGGSLEEPLVFEFTAVSPRLGPVEQGRFSLAERTGGVAGWHWNASGRLAEVDLAGLARDVELAGASGLATGTFEAAGVGAEVARASLELESAGEKIAVSGHYDAAHGRIEALGSAEGVRIEPHRAAAPLRNTGG